MDRHKTDWSDTTQALVRLLTLYHIDEIIFQLCK